MREGGKFAEEVLQPLNQTGDSEGCTRNDDGTVTTPKGFLKAYKAFCENGWGTLSADANYGGQGLPHTLTTVFNEFASSANMAFSMYPGLTAGAVAALTIHGTDDQKQTYLPNMIAGTWTGTMNLTEPHCGTDLGLIRTKAVPQADGSYKITGTKIFISAGQHDMAENIITWCWPASRRPGRHQGHFAVCRAPQRDRRRMARWGTTMAFPAARSSTRWAFTATPPA